MGKAIFHDIMFGLCASISVRKAVRGRLEGIPVPNTYYGCAWFSTIVADILLTVVLWMPAWKKANKYFIPMSLCALFICCHSCSKKYKGYEEF